MRYMIYMLDIMLLIICFDTQCSTSKIKIDKEINSCDSIYITIDSLSYNVHGIYPCGMIYNVVLHECDKKYRIYSDTSSDCAIEIDPSGLYKTDADTFSTIPKKFYAIYIYDIPTGLNKTLIWDKENNVFYLTDWYNEDNCGDGVILSTIDIKQNIVWVKSRCKHINNYKVNMYKIWAPSKKYRDHTRID